MNQPKEPSYPRVPLPLLRQIALDAGVGERTVLRLIMGLPTRPAGHARILAAAARRGVDMARVKQPPPALGPGEEEPPESQKTKEAIAAAERHYGLAPSGAATTTKGT